MGGERGGGVAGALSGDRGLASGSICSVMSPRSALRTACVKGHRARGVAQRGAARGQERGGLRDLQPRAPAQTQPCGRGAQLTSEQAWWAPGARGPWPPALPLPGFSTPAKDGECHWRQHFVLQ